MEERKYQKSYEMGVWDRLGTFFHAFFILLCGILGTISAVGILGVVVSERSLYSLYGPVNGANLWAIGLAGYAGGVAFLSFFSSFEHFRFLWIPNEETKKLKDKSLQLLLGWIALPIVLAIIYVILQTG